MLSMNKQQLISPFQKCLSRRKGQAGACHIQERLYFLAASVLNGSREVDPAKVSAFFLKALAVRR